MFFIYLALLLSSHCLAQTTIDVVHVVFMNHLDVGYNGIPETGFVYNVLNTYFDQYFPLAIATANTMREQYNFHYIYTSHPWLVSMYLDCPPFMNLHCPNETALDDFVGAVNRGDITWHAGPFNQESEILSPDLFLYSMSISAELDKQFGKDRTLTMSQRDVPGLTRSVIPLLNQAGVQAISIGVNSLSSPPAVPTTFVWQDVQSQTETVVIFHPGGYGGISVSDCPMVPGLSHTLATAFNGDNAGPHTVSQVLQIISQLEQEFPNAQILGSTFDDYLQYLLPFKPQLPIVTSEMGDTWIHGVASDPLKVAQYLEIMRARTECLQNGICDENEYEFRNFSRFLVKVAEHTWGLTSGGMFKNVEVDFLYWANDLFEWRRQDQSFQDMQTSWFEQRSFLTGAIDALGNSEADQYLKQDILNRLQYFTEVNVPSTAGFTQITDLQTVFECGRFNLSFSASGGISYLLDTETGLSWASENNLLAQIVYQTFDETDFNIFLANYSICVGLTRCEISLDSDFGKPGLFTADPEHQTVLSNLQTLWYRRNATVAQFLVQVNFLNEELHVGYGAPEEIWLQIDVADDINITLSWFNKTTTRLPESIWLSFNPIRYQSVCQLNWWLNKMSEWVDPFDVVMNGSKHVHAIDKAVSLSSQVPSRKTASSCPSWNLETLDTLVVGVGEPNPFPVPLQTLPDGDKGVSVNFYNNIWDTNYILWYPYTNEEVNSKFRFRITID